MQIIIAILAFVSFTLAFIGLADNDMLISLVGIVGLLTAFMHEEIGA